MQTFLPLPDFHLSAHVLDMRRLGKQRVECLQLLNVNLPLRFPWMGEVKKGWVNHPAAKMWRGYESHLITYAMKVCSVWIARGYKDTLLPRFIAMADQLQVSDPIPAWFKNDEFHESHRSNLLRKNRQWYEQFGWPESDNLPYIWPKGAS